MERNSGYAYPRGNDKLPVGQPPACLRYEGAFARSQSPYIRAAGPGWQRSTTARKVRTADAGIYFAELPLMTFSPLLLPIIPMSFMSTMPSLFFFMWSYIASW